MIWQRHINSLTIWAVLVLLAPLALAAQGPRGTESSAQSNISANLSPLVLISALDDVDLGTWSGAGAMEAEEPNCVWSNTGGYSITGKGSGTDDAFTITQGIDELPYDVKWLDNDGKQVKLKAKRTHSGNITDATAQDCNGNPNSSLFISINRGRLQSGDIGHYRGTLTLIVAVE